MVNPRTVLIACASISIAISGLVLVVLLLLGAITTYNIATLLYHSLSFVVNIIAVVAVVKKPQLLRVAFYLMIALTVVVIAVTIADIVIYSLLLQDPLTKFLGLYNHYRDSLVVSAILNAISLALNAARIWALMKLIKATGGGVGGGAGGKGRV